MPMKKFFFLLFLCLMGWHVAQAQLPNGSIAPDFTVTDLNGNTIHLYDLLDAGKTVYIDVFATWCGPCWNYKNTGAFETIWDTYGPSGTNEAFVLAVEADAATNLACLYGPSGCVGGTQGNWVSGTDHPIVDDPSFNNLYNINYYPTIYMICPLDKKVYETGQLNAANLWAKRAQFCAPPPLESTVNSVNNVRCFGTPSGSINISVVGGIPPYTYLWSNSATTKNIANLTANNYTCTVTAANGTTIVVGPVTVEGPPSALAVSLFESTPMGCNGNLASLTVEGAGGWGNYSYSWNNGINEATISGLTPGNYTVTLTDNSACTKTSVFTVAPATLPQSIIAAPPAINCALPNIQLNGTGSSNGANYTYLWTASNGGNIVSGATTMTPTVNAGGIYALKVTNTENNCSANSATSVTANLTQPSANAGPVQSITCIQNTTTLLGSGSNGSNFTYLWTASNGGNISAGANTLTPTVNATGTYTLKVTNTTNGCTNASATSVTGTAAPVLSTASGTVTCVAPTVTLTTTTNAANPGFAWTGPNGYSSTQQSPVVNVAGAYNLVVTDSVSGCTSTAAASVAANNGAPGAGANGGTLTCVINAVTLAANSPDTNAVFAWTGPNNFSSNAQNPSVNTSGTYNLLVTNPLNGCTSTANAAVALNNTQPATAIAAPANLNCNAAQVQLDATSSSQGSNFNYSWSTTNGNILSGATTLTPVVNQAGNYVLQISNSTNGCTASANTNVNQNQAVAASISAQTNVGCNGASNGTATAASVGGNGTYNYLWSNGATTASVANLAAGTYQVVVTDGEGCTAANNVTISQPEILNANAAATPQSANGVNDGTATAAPLGGTATYNYIWSTNATTQSIADLAPGTYTVTVTDLNGCTSVQSVSVNSFNCTLAATITTVNVSCFGANNGTANVNLSGAANPVTYLWSNGATAATVSNLAPGTYTVNVVDGNNCPATLNTTVAEPVALSANATATSETAAGANNGTATANPVGGAAPFTYLWNNGATTQSISALTPGTYTVVVTDGNGCTNQQLVNVNAFACAVSAQSVVLNVACAGSSNGSVSLVLNNGTAPYTYLWSNGNTTASLNNLAAGTYLATVTDANGCEVAASASVSEPLPFSALLFTTQNPICVGEATGLANASIGGGTQPYTFNWSNGASGAQVQNLLPGTYAVTVQDANNCQTSASVTIVATDNEAPSLSIQNATLPLSANGIVTLSLASLSGIATDNCNIVTTTIIPAAFDCDQLGTHTVTVEVKDAAGLTATSTATVTVVDNTAPVLTCSNSITRCAYDDIVAYNAPVAIDNCLLAAGGQWKLEAGLPSGSEFPVGVTTEIYSFTDGSGNTGTCSFEVIITEPVLFEAPVVVNDLGNQGVGSITMGVLGGVLPLTFSWTLNGVEIATTQNLSGLQAGIYTLTVKDERGCSYEAGKVEVFNTSAAKEPVWLSGVRMQPNPTSGITRILFATPLAGNLEISVIDQTGRILLREISDNQSNIQLDCTALPQGMYTVRFSTAGETGVRKLVISK